MTKRALLIGINAYPNAPLRGCINDVHDVAKTLLQHGYKEKDIVVITDGDARRQRCLDAMKRLRDVSRAGDDLFGQNSSHGDQLPSLDSKSVEPDGLDEVVCMVDYDWSPHTSLVDNDFHEVFSQLDPGVRAFWVADSCHSGTLDRELPRWRPRSHPAPAHPRHPLHPVRHQAAKKGVRTSGLRSAPERMPLAIISGCSSVQTSADAEFGGRPNGALTYFLLQQISQTPHASARQIVQRVQHKLAAAGYTQRPELIGAVPLIDQPFFQP